MPRRWRRRRGSTTPRRPFSYSSFEWIIVVSLLGQLLLQYAQVRGGIVFEAMRPSMVPRSSSEDLDVAGVFVADVEPELVEL